jgi:hypothetical protein
MKKIKQESTISNKNLEGFNIEVHKKLEEFSKFQKPMQDAAFNE